MTPLQSEITALVAGDWVLVPRELTQAMANAGDDVIPELEMDTTSYARLAWSAMIAAAPSPDDTATRIVEVVVERCAREATSFLVGDPANGVPLRNPMAHEVADRIRSLITESRP